MCPLFAPDGSPWTGDYDTLCIRDDCAFFYKGYCDGAAIAHHQIEEFKVKGNVLQIGKVRAEHGRVKQRNFDCPNVNRCQWQHEAGDALCPPRKALAQGIDPRVVAY